MSIQKVSHTEGRVPYICPKKEPKSGRSILIKQVAQIS